MLVLDEPSAALPADEVHRLFDAMRPLKARGVGMIYVSHRLDEVFEIADRVAVLRDGALVGERECRGDDAGRIGLADRRQGAGAFSKAPRAPPACRRASRRSGLAVEGAGPVDIAVAKSEISAWSACAAPARN